MVQQGTEQYRRAEDQLRGKVVVMTGASSGFGKGAALEFAKGGAHVVLAARRRGLLEDLAVECRRYGVRAHVVATDVSKHDDVAALHQEAITQFGRIDVWVNNAGVGVLGRLDEIPIADQVQVIQTNLIGALYGTYYAIRQFRAQGNGTLINVASELGRGTTPYYAAYAASKHGVMGLSIAARQELQADDIDAIHVCTVLPSAMDTPFWDHAGNYTGHEATPIPPLYDPHKVIDTIVELAVSPEAEVQVGFVGKLRTEMQEMMPRLSERLSAKFGRKVQMTDPPPTPSTPGSVHEPQPVGTGVSAGRRHSDVNAGRRHSDPK